MSVKGKSVREPVISEPEREAGYEVLFIGLACHLTQPKKRKVLWPDGSNPPARVTPHYAYLAVDPSAIQDQEGWFPGDEAQDDLMASGLFRLPKCKIFMDGTDKGTGLNTTDHDQFLPRLSAGDPTVEINPSDVNAIAEMTLSSGTLTAVRTGGVVSKGTVDAAVISQLRVEHDGPITVRIEPQNGRERTLLLEPGTSVAVANIAFPDEGTGVEHFSIYGQLARSRRLAGRAEHPPSTIPILKTTHHLFTLGVSISDGSADCGVVRCCP
jgi:hypothetical protein